MSELPADSADSFGMNCRPVKESDSRGLWPARNEIERRLKEQLDRVLQIIAGLPADVLSAKASAVRGSRNLLSAAVHAWHDESKHQGEMYLLLKMRKAFVPSR